ncbi:unnamed protein product [Effrenium voratum]|nr:unnamed protein product [Effrenium voratum]
MVIAAHKAIDTELKRPSKKNVVPVRERRRSSVIVKKHSTSSSNSLQKLSGLCRGMCCPNLLTRLQEKLQDMR